MGDAYWATQNKTESQRTRCLWSRGQDDTYGCSQDEGVLAIGSKPRVLQLETVDSLTSSYTSSESTFKAETLLVQFNPGPSAKETWQTNNSVY